MRVGLVGRILALGGVVLAFLVIELVLVIRSIESVRSATRSEQHAGAAVIAAIRVEKLVVDLETGARGYVITRDPRFLEPWRAARQALPRRQRDLVASAPGGEARAIVDATQAYEREWAVPIVRIAAAHPQQALGAVASGDSKRRVDEIRRMIDPFVRAEEASSAHQRRRVADAEHMGVVVGLSGIGAAILLVVLIVGYFLRSAIAPVRRIATATATVAAGNLGVEVPPQGVGEVGQLASAFNEMSRSLARQQRALSEQNVDLERLATILRTVLDSTIDGILLSDPEGNIQLANRPMVQLTKELGMSFEGTVVDRLISVSDRIGDPARFREAMARLRTNPEQPTFDEFEDVVTGRVFQGFTAPVHGDGGDLVGRVWTLRDVTQERELDQLKDDFVATVSHELRTPLTSMMGFLEMIREEEAGELTDEQKRYLAIVYRSSERLQRLVGDLLFVARLDANGFQLQLAPVAVDEVVHEAVESSAALARSRELELVPEIESTPPITADRERLAQLAGNLVSNALKFTRAGGRVVVRCFSTDGRVVFEVEDTGVGIPEAEHDRLFQRFFRSSTAAEQAIPGTGLGLVISKAIAEAHGGTIDVESRSGVGTRVRVELPLERPADVAPETPS
jgi:signal transduction histidine kinase/CHASE3 domain sensor protein